MSDGWDPNFDVCVFCGTDGCAMGTDVHAEDCPSTTGVFPVHKQDLGPECPHCGKGFREHDFGCCRCDHTFSLGEQYHHIRIEDTGESFPGYEVVCAGCAAHEALGEAA